MSAHPHHERANVANAASFIDRRSAAVATVIAAAALGAAFCAVAPRAAHALEVTLPTETARYAPSDLPGYQLAQRNCLICHSAQYVQTQPPGTPRSYWQATVTKMQKVFGAPLKTEDMPAIVDYLSKTYGAESSNGGTAGVNTSAERAPGSTATADFANAPPGASGASTPPATPAKK